MRFLVGVWVLVLVLSLAGATFAQNVQNDPVWKALVTGDKAVAQGQLHFTRHHLPFKGGLLETHVYSYAPVECFVDVQTGISPKVAPFTIAFDGHDSWTQQPLGINLGPNRMNQGFNGSYGGFVPRACFPMGRGLSFLKNPTISHANGQITVSGEWDDVMKITATVDPKAGYLARTITISDNKDRLSGFWRITGSLAQNRIGSSATYSFFISKSKKLLYDSYAITSANFAPLNGKVFEPKTSGVNVYDFRVSEAHPAFYMGGVPSGMTKSQVLADTAEYVAGQKAMQTRGEWGARLAIGGLGLGALAILLGGTGILTAAWSRRKARADNLTPTRSKVAARFILAGALCAWGLVLGIYGAFTGWTPASLSATRSGNLRVQQAQVAAKTSFGTIAASDPRLKSALAATNLAGVASMVMKAGAVVGVVSDVRQTGGGGKLSLDFAANRTTATRAVVTRSVMNRFPNLQTLIGKKVYVFGLISPRRDGGEIILHAPSQILIVK